MIRKLLLLSIVTLFFLFGGVSPISAGQAVSASASIQATASVVYPVGITTLENSAGNSLPSKGASSVTYICAPENRSLMMIVQVGNRDVCSRRVQSGRVTGVTGLLPKNGLTVSELGVDAAGCVTVTLIDPDV